MTTCYMCDLPGADIAISGLYLHDHCVPEYPANIPVCKDERCGWWQTLHSGPCVV